MFSDLKFTLRRLLKNKFTTTINLIGLTMGLFVSLTLANFVIQEHSVDGFHSKSDRILKSVSRIDFGSGLNTFPITFGTLAEAFKLNFPQVESTTRVYGRSSVEVGLGNKRFNDIKVLRFDYSFFEIFDFEGIPKGSFSDPNHAVISKKTAKTMFNGDAIGKEIEIENKNYTVVATVDLPHNTIFQFDIGLPLYSMHYYEEMVNGGMEFETYTLLQEGTNIEAMQIELSKFQDDYTLKKWPEYQSESLTLPMDKVYLNDDGIPNKLSNGNAMQVRVVTGIAIVVFFLALINYINLQISSNHSRTVELKLKRVMGAKKWAIVKQGMLESLVLILLSLIAAVILLATFYEYLPDQLFGKTGISILDIDIKTQIFFVLVIFLVGTFAGIIPAAGLFENNFGSQQNLGDRSISKTTVGMVLFQFFITSALLTSALFIHKQMDMLQKQPKGYASEQVLMINNLSDVQAEKFDLIKSQLEKQSSVLAVGAAQSAPGDGASGQFVSPEGSDAGIETAHIRTLAGYAQTLNLQFVDGRDFTNVTFEGEKQFVINETAANLLFPNKTSVIGEKIDLSGRKGTIVGVVKDFHFRSLKHQISPLVLNIEKPYKQTLMVRMDVSNVSIALDHIKEVLSGVDINYVFDYQFLDARFSDFYANEIRTKRIMTHSMVVAFIISIMGLLSLSLFVINSKLKEVAIRKVLGGSASHIFMKLSKRLIVWILTGGILSLPLSYLIAKSWVSDFVYQIDLSNILWMGALSSATLLLIGFTIIIRKLLNAIHMNPIIFLSNE